MSVGLQEGSTAPSVSSDEKAMGYIASILLVVFLGLGLANTVWMPTDNTVVTVYSVDYDQKTATIGQFGDVELENGALYGLSEQCSKVTVEGWFTKTVTSAKATACPDYLLP